VKRIGKISVTMLARYSVLDEVRNRFEYQHRQNNQADDVSHDITSKTGYTTPLKKQ
jgi:hypothetical protein